MSTQPSPPPVGRPPTPVAQQPAAAGTESAGNSPGALPPLGSDPGVRASTPPAILQAQEAFRRDRPALLRERPGQWVAYHGDHRIGFGRTQDALWRECRRQGYHDFLIRCIWPYAATDFLSTL
jgi:hypothetical protein